MDTQLLETKEWDGVPEKHLPTLDSFPEGSREIIRGWITAVKESRASRERADEVTGEILRMLEPGLTGSERDYASLWACEEFIEALRGEMIGKGGEKIPPLEPKGAACALVNRGFWPEKERSITRGQSIFTHSVNLGGFQEIVRQVSIACRARQEKPRFTTGQLKHPTQEMKDVSFHWNTHTSSYGGFCFVIPADLALREAVFCDCDGIHVLNKNVEEGYFYSLNQPFVVIIGKPPTNEEWGSLFGPTKGVAWEKSVDVALEELGWFPDEISAWKEKHLVIGDQRDEKENESLGAKMSGVQWNLRTDQLSPLKQRVSEKLKAQGYFPVQSAHFYPSGEKTDLDTKGTYGFWLYQLK